MPALLRTGLLLCAAVQAPSAPVDATPRRDTEFASFAGDSPTPAPAPPLPRFGAIIPGSDVVPPVAESYLLGDRLESLDLVERGADLFNVSLTTLRADRGGPGSTLFGDLSFRVLGLPHRAFHCPICAGPGPTPAPVRPHTRRPAG